MGEKTGISWTDSTWNPTRGCTRVSPGCGGANHEGGCYAEKIAARFSDPGQAYHSFAERSPHGGRWTGKVNLVPGALDLPLRWRRPRRIFANSTSDLFHEALPIEDIATVMAIAVASVHLRGHTIQILTKRADRMREALHRPEFWEQVNAEAGMHILDAVDPLDRRSDDARATLEDYGPGHPPPGIWLGVSVEDQERADERIAALLETPSVIRFLSCEPLIGPLDIRQWLLGISWTIVGGESGPRSRLFDLDWAVSLAKQCRDAAVPFFMKQVGSNPGLNGYAGYPTTDRSGGNIEDFPSNLRIRQFPTVA